MARGPFLLATVLLAVVACAVAHPCDAFGSNCEACLQHRGCDFDLTPGVEACLAAKDIPGRRTVTTGGYVLSIYGRDAYPRAPTTRALSGSPGFARRFCEEAQDAYDRAFAVRRDYVGGAAPEMKIKGGEKRKRGDDSDDEEPDEPSFKRGRRTGPAGYQPQSEIPEMYNSGEVHVWPGMGPAMGGFGTPAAPSGDVDMGSPSMASAMSVTSPGMGAVPASLADLYRLGPQAAAWAGADVAATYHPFTYAAPAGQAEPLIKHFDRLRARPNCVKTSAVDDREECYAADLKWVEFNSFRTYRQSLLETILGKPTTTADKARRVELCKRIRETLGDANAGDGRCAQGVNRLSSAVLVFGVDGAGGDLLDGRPLTKVPKLSKRVDAGVQAAAKAKRAEEIERLITEHQGGISSELVSPKEMAKRMKACAAKGTVCVMTLGVMMDTITDGAVHWMTYVFNPFSTPPTLTELDPGTGIDEANTLDGYRVDDDLKKELEVGIIEAGYPTLAFNPSALDQCPQRWQRDGFCQTWSMFLLWLLVNGYDVAHFPYTAFGPAGLKMWILFMGLQTPYIIEDSATILDEFFHYFDHGAEAFFWAELGEAYLPDPAYDGQLTSDGGLGYFNMMEVALADPTRPILPQLSPGAVMNTCAAGPLVPLGGRPVLGHRVDWARQNLNFLTAFENYRLLRVELGLPSW